MLSGGCLGRRFSSHLSISASHFQDFHHAEYHQKLQTAWLVKVPCLTCLQVGKRLIPVKRGILHMAAAASSKQTCAKFKCAQS
ncbi:hypothetical protein M758_6G064500 [Ceratodon purpureus]|uniref:Uncharacterized protein n=1 Tax=Ceratodon purpureus TaxID=3225 RepID=A0A8T0HGF2_CERPU|nr:hypothetical protein KC19_6G068600 [Ceratodon purpureus]KAG0612942.1 hypothetical protein M758_6G064500 [Ceratodon purpureus]